MIPQASLSVLFHELFDAPWPQDDPQFCAELLHYKSTILKLLSLDDQLSHFISSQPVLDNDQISTIPLAIGSRKIMLLASVEPSNMNQFQFKLSCSPCNFDKAFSVITVETGTKKYEYSSSDKSTDCIKIAFDAPSGSNVTVTCEWSMPLLMLSTPLHKIMGSPVGVAGEIASKILAHIDSRNLMVGDGEVKCDGTLKTITGKDYINLNDIAEVISNNTKPIQPYVFQLDLPSSSRAFSLQVPSFNTDEVPENTPIKLPEPPIRKFLETALESKRQLLLHEAFEKFPLQFVDECTLEEAKEIDATDLANSTHLFSQPWVLDQASDFLRSTEFVKAVHKTVHQPPSNQPQFR